MNQVEVLWWTTALTVAAIIAAPITALWVQRMGDECRALRTRREAIFRTLWTNRARPAYIVRVDALNMIDVEFHGEQKVIEAWADLFAHFNTDFKTEGISDAEQARRHKEKYATLLWEMGQLLGYKLSKTHIRDDVYRPDIHNEFDMMDLQTRRSTVSLLTALDSMEALPVRFVTQEKPAESPIDTNAELPLPDKQPRKR
jgi:hypothetical protein